jgi:hypothetical protein
MRLEFNNLWTLNSNNRFDFEFINLKYIKVECNSRVWALQINLLNFEIILRS